jgi:hypothetical protein
MENGAQIVLWDWLGSEGEHQQFYIQEVGSTVPGPTSPGTTGSGDW